MAQAKTNISCHGDDNYKRALGTLAARHKVKVGDLVRDALDKAYGKEIAEIETFLFANDGAQKHQWHDRDKQTA